MLELLLDDIEKIVNYIIAVAKQMHNDKPTGIGNSKGEQILYYLNKHNGDEYNLLNLTFTLIYLYEIGEKEYNFFELLNRIKINKTKLGEDNKKKYAYCLYLSGLDQYLNKMNNGKLKLINI